MEKTNVTIPFNLLRYICKYIDVTDFDTINLGSVLRLDVNTSFKTYRITGTYTSDPLVGLTIQPLQYEFKRIFNVIINESNAPITISGSPIGEPNIPSNSTALVLHNGTEFVIVKLGGADPLTQAQIDSLNLMENVRDLPTQDVQHFQDSSGFPSFGGADILSFENWTWNSINKDYMFIRTDGGHTATTNPIFDLAINNDTLHIQDTEGNYLILKKNYEPYNAGSDYNYTPFEVIVNSGDFFPDISSSYNKTFYTEVVKGYNPLIEITYDNLKGLSDSNNLVEGQKYKITDYSTIYTQLDTGLLSTNEASLTAALEPIIVTARSSSLLFPRVESTIYVSDIIRYDTNFFNTNDKGRITYRESTNGIVAPFDWRKEKFRLHKLLIPDFNIATSYNSEDIVKVPNTTDPAKAFDCYVRLPTITNIVHNIDASNDLTNPRKWMLLSEDLTEDYLVGINYVISNNVTVDPVTFQDFLPVNGSTSNVTFSKGIVIRNGAKNSIISSTNINSTQGANYVVSVNKVLESEVYIHANCLIFNVERVNLVGSGAIIMDLKGDTKARSIKSISSLANNPEAMNRVVSFYSCVINKAGVKNLATEIAYQELFIGGEGRTTIENRSLYNCVFHTQHNMDFTGDKTNETEVTNNTTNNDLTRISNLVVYNYKGRLIFNAAVKDVVIDAVDADIISGNNPMGFFTQVNMDMDRVIISKDPTYTTGHHTVVFDLDTEFKRNVSDLKCVVVLKSTFEYTKVSASSYEVTGDVVKFFTYSADPAGALVPTQVLN